MSTAHSIFIKFKDTRDLAHVVNISHIQQLCVSIPGPLGKIYEVALMLYPTERYESFVIRVSKDTYNKIEKVLSSSTGIFMYDMTEDQK